MRYFAHSSKGVLDFHKDDWVLVLCDNEIINYYLWLSKRYGIPFYKGSLYGAHITIARGRFKIPKELIEKYHGQTVNFKYTHEIYYNDLHLWLNVDSDEIYTIHKEIMKRDFEKRDKTRYSFHITIGRFVNDYKRKRD
jgi:2'-5' RNA ligase